MNNFLDKTGLAYFWGKIKAVFAKKEDVVVYNATSETSGTAAATATPYYATRWRVDLSDQVTELYSGLTILFKIPVAGNGTYGTLLRIDGTAAADDSSDNLYPVCANVSTMISTRYAVGCIIALTFDASQVGQTLYYNSNSAYTTAANGTGWTKPGCWKVADYDTNTTITYGTLDYYFRPYTGTRLTPYKIVALDKDNRVIPITTEQYCGTYGSSTSYVVDDIVVYNNVYYKCITAGKNKTPSTSTSYWQTYTMPTQFTPIATPFRPEKLRFYGSSTLLAAGAATGGQSLTEIGYNTSVCAYTFWATISSYRVIYLQGTYDRTTGLFTLDSGADYYKLVPCNTANLTLSSYFTSGKYYILLGSTYSSNNYFQLFMVNTMYYFDGTNLIPYENKLASDVAASIPTVPTNVSDFNNDAGYLTSYTETDPTVPSWAKASSKPSYTASEVGAVPTTRTVNGKALSSDITLSASDVNALPSSTAIPDDLADLNDDSTHRLVTDTEKSTWNAKGTYSKPSGGIPKTDLANAVQTSLGKADTALQSFTESDPVFAASAAHGITSSDITNWNSKTSNVGTITGVTGSDGLTGSGTSGSVTIKHAAPSTSPAKSTSAVYPITIDKYGHITAAGTAVTIPSAVTESTVSGWGFTKNAGTITGITMNGASKGTSGVVNLGTVITAHQDISGKADKATTLSGYGITDAKIENGVITLGSNNITPLTEHLDITGKQDTLVSGTNIKTINGETLLGSGDIELATNIPEINHGTSDTTFLLTPNVMHIWGEVASLTLTLPIDTNEILDEFMFTFTSGATPTTLSLPLSIKWMHNLSVEANKTYLVSIVNGLAGYMTENMNTATIPIESISVNNVELTITNNNVNITVPTKVSDLTNDSGYLTLHLDISGKADKTATVSTVTYDTTNHKITKTINGVTTDVVTAAQIVADGGSSSVTFRVW